MTESNHVVLDIGVLLPGSPPGGTPAKSSLSPSKRPSMANTLMIEEEAGEEERNLDNYIPFRLAALRDTMFEDYPEIFHQAETREKFFKLIKWLQIRNSTKLAIMYEHMDDLYSFIDPDGGIENPEAAYLSEDQKTGYFENFVQEFHDVMEMGDFDRLSHAFLEEAYDAQGHSAGFLGTGLEVKPTDTDIIDFRLWYRGKVKSEVKYRTWRTGFLQKTQVFYTFDRLVIMFRKKPKHVIEELERQNKTSCWAKMVEYCYDFLLRQGKQNMSQDDELKPGYLYLKVFKTVSHTDIDMLMPGAEGKFSWMDYILIWGSILLAIGFAAYRLGTGTLAFDNTVGIATALVLIVMPLYGAYNGYDALQKKIQDLQSHLNALYIMHNLASNNGVLSQVLDEALEQEDKETLLAYFFLWCGLQEPVAMSRRQLDRSVEDFLEKQLKRSKLEQIVDFEVTDALEKLRRMSILVGVDEENVKSYKVLPLDEALEAAHIKHFDEAREVLGLKRIGTVKRAPGAILWKECVDTFPATGQRFRFFWNIETGDSTFAKPEKYISLSDAKQSSDKPLALNPDRAPVPYMMAGPPAANILQSKKEKPRSRRSSSGGRSDYVVAAPRNGIMFVSDYMYDR